MFKIIPRYKYKITFVQMLIRIRVFLVISLLLLANPDPESQLKADPQIWIRIRNSDEHCRCCLFLVTNVTIFTAAAETKRVIFGHIIALVSKFGSRKPTQGGSMQIRIRIQNSDEQCTIDVVHL
jgi:hypothetical protein